MKVGKVAFIGRPNTGKSTLLNTILQQKVAITSPKPQTTHFPIFGIYEDTRGQILFIDTPGVFAKAKGERHKYINMEAEKILQEDVNCIVYIIDKTRQRGFEENRILGMIRKIHVPKIIVINKVDIEEPDFRSDYTFLEDEFDITIQISALKGWNIDVMLTKLFEYLPEGEKVVERETLPIPVLNLTSEMYIEEIIREKAFLTLWKEIPYTIHVVIDKIEERDEKTTYIKARIITTHIRYRKMIIGKNAEIIKQIGTLARKELENATGRKIFLDLIVEVG